MTATAPCATCPWRKTSTVGGEDIPNFNIELMRGLAKTVGDEDGFRTIMACHGSACGAETPCVGYLAVEGYSNLNARMMRFDWLAIDEGCAGIELWPSFHEMLNAYEAAQ